MASDVANDVSCSRCYWKWHSCHKVLYVDRSSGCCRLLPYLFSWSCGALSSSGGSGSCVSDLSILADVFAHMPVVQMIAIMSDNVFSLDYPFLTIFCFIDIKTCYCILWYISKLQYLFVLVFMYCYLVWYICTYWRPTPKAMETVLTFGGMSLLRFFGG